MEISGVYIGSGAVLAPMAGVGDMSFRLICRECGASMTVTEMVSAKGLVYGDRKTAELMEIAREERPAAIQLFGSDPEVMARASEHASKLALDFIDINMGCPVPKIVGNGDGSAVMRDPELVYRIVKAVVSSGSVPVTVKLRKGIDGRDTAIECAKAAEAGGASAVTVHGKTREQQYRPGVDLDIIRDVKGALSIPVIGNGDVDGPLAAAHMLDYTGCDGVMVGRAALGDPFVFSRIRAYLERGELIPEATVEMKMAAATRQAAHAVSRKGEKRAILEMRKHIAWYTKGLRGAAGYRTQANGIATMDDFRRLADRILSESGGDNVEF